MGFISDLYLLRTPVYVLTKFVSVPYDMLKDTYYYWSFYMFLFVPYMSKWKSLYRCAAHIMSLILIAWRTKKMPLK